MGARNNHRRLTFVLSFTSFISNACSIYLFHHLPDDPLHLARHISIYSYFATTFSLLGLVGAAKSNSIFVAIFANYLLIDILVCTIPRLLAMTTFPELRELICSKDTIYAWLQTQTAFSEATDADASAMHRHMLGQCRRVVGIVFLLTAIMAVGLTVVQLLLTFRVSAYARLLQKEEQDARGKVVLSKVLTEDDPPPYTAERSTPAMHVGLSKC